MLTKPFIYLLCVFQKLATHLQTTIAAYLPPSLQKFFLSATHSDVSTPLKFQWLFARIACYSFYDYNNILDKTICRETWWWHRICTSFQLISISHSIAFYFYFFKAKLSFSYYKYFWSDRHYNFFSKKKTKKWLLLLYPCEYMCFGVYLWMSFILSLFERIVW